MTSTNSIGCKVGEVIEVEIKKVAHGGHCIAHFDGALIFVRHAIPGEMCRVVITSIAKSFNRGDVIEVLKPSPDRVIAPCTFAHRKGCGGCDFQHISLVRQRQLKSAVVKEQFLRIAKMEIEVEVEEVGEALHWRTRLTATTTSDGKLGFYATRTHTVVPVTDCVIAVKALEMPELAARTWKSDVRVEISVDSAGRRNIALAPKQSGGKARLTEGNQRLHHNVRGRDLEVSQDSFWQSHISAPEVLVSALLEYAKIESGDYVLDLYGGVGLFTSAMLHEVGTQGRVDLIEASKSATRDAIRNFADNENVKIINGDVAAYLPQILQADVIVLDPPREGAGRSVVAGIVKLAPRSVVYISCDPASLARDSAYFFQMGYALAKIRAFDLFPMTHHIECVALYLPA